jgi:hypothetical protein
VLPQKYNVAVRSVLKYGIKELDFGIEGVFLENVHV